jgi:chemotaxis signal transduction protein
MNASAPALARRLAELRDAFDRPFAEPPRAVAVETEDLLAIRIAGDPYALRVRDLTGLGSNRKIVPVPSSRAELLGLAGIRGNVVLVYSLPLLLGYGPGGGPPPWLALCGAPAPVALAFDELESFVRVRRTDLSGAGPADGANRHVMQVVRVGASVRRIVDTRSVLATVKPDAGTPGATKEQ